MNEFENMGGACNEPNGCKTSGRTRPCSRTVGETKPSRMNGRVRKENMDYLKIVGIMFSGDSGLDIKTYTTVDHMICPYHGNILIESGVPIEIAKLTAENSVLIVRDTQSVSNISIDMDGLLNVFKYSTDIMVKITL